MLKWVFGADTSPFRRSLQEMRNDVKSFSGDAQKNLMGMFGAGAVIASVKGVIDHFARLKDIADRFGESSESMQKVGAAAEQAGTDIETVAKAMTVTTKNAVAAASGNDEMAESFQRLGIDAANFANLPIEEKLKELNQGFNASENSAQAMTDIMKVLGKSGAEMIPLLSQGMEEFQAQLDNTITATDGQVEAIARLDDRLAELKQVGAVVGAELLGAFKFLFGFISAVGATTIMQTVNAFRVLGKVGAESAVVIGKILTGDFSGAAEAGKAIGDAISNGVSEAVKNAKAGISQISDEWNDAFNPSSSSGKDQGPAIENAKAAEESAKQQMKIDEERKRLAEDIAKLEEDARIKSLSLAEKILDAEKRRKQLLREDFTARGNDHLKKSAEILKVEKELAGYKEQQADIDKKAQDEKQQAIEKNAEAMRTLAEKSVELERSNKLAGMSDVEKREFLKKERAQALKDSKDANARGDYKGGLEAGNKAKELTGQIDEISRTIRDKAQNDLQALQSRGPTIATSALADIGGGGTASMMESDYPRKMVDYLAIIAANTAGGADGSRPPEPI